MRSTTAALGSKKKQKPTESVKGTKEKLVGFLYRAGTQYGFEPAKKSLPRTDSIPRDLVEKLKLLRVQKPSFLPLSNS